VPAHPTGLYIESWFSSTRRPNPNQNHANAAAVHSDTLVIESSFHVWLGEYVGNLSPNIGALLFDWSSLASS